MHLALEYTRTVFFVIIFREVCWTKKLKRVSIYMKIQAVFIEFHPPKGTERNKLYDKIYIAETVLLIPAGS